MGYDMHVGVARQALFFYSHFLLFDITPTINCII